MSASTESHAFKPVAAVELDADAAASYAYNVGEHVYCGDIGSWLRTGDLPTDVDVVLGGPPCQGFSALGKQVVRDARNAMWRRYVEAVAAMQPSFFVLENVREFLKSGQYLGLRRECRPSGALPEYVIESFVLDSSLYGSPQRRKRAIVIGRRSAYAALGVPPESDERSTVRDAFDGLEHDIRKIELPERYAEFQGQPRPGPFSGNELHITRRFTDLSLERYKAIPPGGNRFDIPQELLAPCWRNHRTGSCDVMGRLHWDAPSVTIRTEFFKPEKGRYLHPEADRPLTHLEAARLQGFPDDYGWYGSKSSIARQIGNAVPLPLGRALGELVLRSLVARDDELRTEVA